MTNVPTISNKNNNSRKNRSTVNLLCLIVTLCILFISVGLSDGSFATNIHKITEKLDKSLTEIMSDNANKPHYTDINNGVDSNFTSDVIYDAKGMQGLYNLTVLFVDLVLPEVNLSDFLIFKDKSIELAPVVDNWEDLVKKYVGILVIIIILLLLIVFLPLCGFGFCCCRCCCGKCGSRSKPYDKNNDFCKKFVYATILIVLGTTLLFCVVCAFASNEQMNEGVNEFSVSLKKGITDVGMFIDGTKNQLNNLLTVNYNEFNTAVTSILDQSSDLLYENLMELSKAISLTKMKDMVTRFDKIETDMNSLKSDSKTLRNYASQLNDALRQLKASLLQDLNSNECENVQECKNLRSNINTLTTNITFNQIPDLKDQIEKFDEINKMGLAGAVDSGIEKLEKVHTDIGTKTGEMIKTVKSGIKTAGENIASQYAEVNNIIEDFKKQIISTGNDGVDKADPFIKNYSKYVHYVGLAMSCILLLISLCIMLGLICGICGKRPNGYGDDCCNKGAGSQFLICGVMIMFIFGFLMAIVVLATFLIGTLGDKVICDTLQNPNESDLLDNLNKIIELPSEMDSSITIKTIINKCKADNVIYEAFGLQTQFKLDEIKNYIDTLDIRDALNDLKLDNIVPNDTTLIDQTTQKKLDAWVDKINTDDFHFEKFEDLASEQLTTYNLSSLCDQIDAIVNKLPDKLKSSLNLAKLQLQTYDDKIVRPMIETIGHVTITVKDIQTNIEFNGTKFNQAIKDVLEEIDYAENSFNSTQMKPMLENVIKTFADGVIDPVQAYLNRVVDSIQTNVGKCGPLFNIYNTTTIAACDNIILRLNGFWFSIFLSLLLFIPLIIISVILSTLYQKHHPYASTLIEAEYLYDAYAERDSIPLNSRNNKGKKKKYKRHHDDRSMLPGPGGDMSRDYPGGSHYQEGRYADMAPKQWEDFPAGGPPQYHRAPTEYERPPPYYYPGTNETN